MFEIKSELASTYQGTLDIASYFNKLKRIWDELGVMCTRHANSCICAAKKRLHKEKEKDRVHQFLMGLNNICVGVRSNILMMQPLPSLDIVYSILLQDEKQRHVVATTQCNTESASLMQIPILTNSILNSHLQNNIYKRGTLFQATKNPILISLRLLCLASIERNLVIQLKNAINYMDFHQISNTQRVKSLVLLQVLRGRLRIFCIIFSN